MLSGGPLPPAETTQIDVNDLFSKLLSSGIIKKNVDQLEAMEVAEAPPCGSPVPPTEQKQQPEVKPQPIAAEEIKKEVLTRLMVPMSKPLDYYIKHYYSKQVCRYIER